MCVQKGILSLRRPPLKRRGLNSPIRPTTSAGESIEGVRAFPRRPLPSSLPFKFASRVTLQRRPSVSLAAAAGETESGGGRPLRNRAGGGRPWRPPSGGACAAPRPLQSGHGGTDGRRSRRRRRRRPVKGREVCTECLLLFYDCSGKELRR